MSRTSLRQLPFYTARLDARGRPAPWTLEELEAFAASRSDPFAGRLAPGATPPLSLQLEGCDDPPLWVGLGRGELETWSRVLEAAWARYGLEPGECLAIFDYGSSPLVLLASASYTPHLRRGAAERLGIRVICNDGVAVLAERMVEIVTQLRPAALVVRRDALAPLGAVLETTGVALDACCRWVAVTDADGVPEARELDRWSQRWSLPLHRFLRADAGLVLAGDCPECSAFHLHPRHYRVEALDDAGVCVTTRFARTTPSVRQRLHRAQLAAGSCPREPDASRLDWR
jgi:hypothetical protein